MSLHRALRAALGLAIALGGVAVDGATLSQRADPDPSEGEVQGRLEPRAPTPSAASAFFGAPPVDPATRADRGEAVADAFGPADPAEVAALSAWSEPAGRVVGAASQAGLPAALRVDQALPPVPDPPPKDEANDAGTEPVEAPAEDPDHPVLVSTGRETWVFAEPRWDARQLGYLRAGATVERARKAATRKGCRGGWYRVAPEGYVCVGSRASLDRNHPVARLSARRPDLAGLPYTYALTRDPPPSLYGKLPSDEELRAVEGDVSGHLRAYRGLATNPDFVPPPAPEPLPEALASGELLPATAGPPRQVDGLVVERAKAHSGWALLGSYDWNGRRYGLTTDLALVPLDRARVVRPSTFRGVELSDEIGLPIAIVRSRRARGFRLAEAGGLLTGPGYEHRQFLSLTGAERRSPEGLLLEVRDGSWVRADQVTVIERYDELPRFARHGDRWIDVSILRQSLVAYQGARPVYATLVSTGRDGLADPKDSHATVQGTFLVHTKHLTVTMDSEDEKEEFDLRDVPYVQYFTEGYALHAAYWHDDFGTPRSHGCVNLAPIDAAWLFGFTTPTVPEGWHAAMSLKDRTIVHIHP